MCSKRFINYQQPTNSHGNSGQRSRGKTVNNWLIQTDIRASDHVDNYQQQCCKSELNSWHPGCLPALINKLGSWRKKIQADRNLPRHETVLWNYPRTYFFYELPKRHCQRCISWAPAAIVNETWEVTPGESFSGNKLSRSATVPFAPRPLYDTLDVSTQNARLCLQRSQAKKAGVLFAHFTMPTGGAAKNALCQQRMPVGRKAGSSPQGSNRDRANRMMLAGALCRAYVPRQSAWWIAHSGSPT